MSNEPEEQSGSATAGEAERWLDRPGSVNLLIKILVTACVFSFAADFFYHKHAEFSFQGLPGFDALWGFAAYVSLVMLAKQWRKVVMRREDYYD